jgi:peptide chain release factor 2
MENQAKDLQVVVSAAINQLKIHQQAVELMALTEQSTKSGFWNDSTHAQSVMKQIAKLKDRLSPWLSVESGINDLIELAAVEDESLKAELITQFESLLKQFETLKEDLKFSGPYDSQDAILSIHAGAGGTDAQDWTQILFRMYNRYFENNRWKVVVADESSGDEAGLKSVTVEVEGKFAYGKLKSENGVHRLVRLSPFNADNLRQTSFAKVEVMPKIDKPEDLEIDDKDLKIDVYRSGGKGGQSVNTTDSAVRITHTPTNIVVAIQTERSQLQNRETAMTILRSRLAQLQLEQHQDKISEIKGPNQSAEWGNQIRSYVLHPYKQVKDLRTRYETSDPDSVLNGNLDPLINAYLDHTLSDNNS